MNVLFVTPEYPRNGQPTTGFPNYLYRVSLSLLRLGHKPVILSAGNRDSHRVEDGIEIWTVAVPHTDVKPQALSYAANALKIGYALNKKIGEIADKTQIDIIQFTSLYGLAFFYSGKIPAVLRLSSYARTAFVPGRTFPMAAIKVMSFFERASARRCSVIFSPCRKNAQIYGTDCGRNVKVIETPFVNDVREYDNGYFEEYLDGKKYVLFFGTMYIEKGIAVIADILERFLADNLDYYFVFIGEVCSINGESAAALLKRKAGSCSDRVIIGKALPHRQLYPVIKNADFVVLPSLMDNLSNACIEAMYFERVVIGTDGASFEQLITHGKNGLLCRIGDSRDLLDKMQEAVSMPDGEKIRMGKLAGRRIDRLKPEYAVRKLVRLYEHVILNGKFSN